MDDLAGDLEAAQGGCLDAFGRLYDRFGPLVLAVCRTGGCAPDAEDAAQEVFMRAHRKLGDVAAPAGLGAWLVAIARRVCAERRRALRRRAHHEENAAMRRTLTTASSESTTADLVRAEDLERLTAALARLPENERLAIHAHYLDDGRPGDAPAVLGISKSGFYKLLERARRRLATLMNEVHGHD